MSRQKAWKRTCRMLNAPNLKKWYKKLIRRRNRRKAKLDPESQDRPLDPWAID